MHKPTPATVIALIALFVALGGVSVAATGGNFILGQPNTATSKTALTAGINDRALAITNTNTSSSATALGLNVAANRPPLIVSSSTKVDKLNADLLDGRDSTYFLTGTTVHRFGPVTYPTGGSAFDLITIGQVTLVGECTYDSDFNEQGGHLDIKTSVAGSAYADVTTSGTTNGTAAMNAGPQIYPLGGQFAVSGTQTFTPVTGEALSHNGQELFYDLYVGQNAAGATGNKCTFGGSIVVK